MSAPARRRWRSRRARASSAATPTRACRRRRAHGRAPPRCSPCSPPPPGRARRSLASRSASCSRRSPPRSDLAPGGWWGTGWTPTWRARGRSDGRPAGWLSCEWEGSAARLDELWVEPEWRGRLVGAHLLLTAAVRLRAAGVRRLTANPTRLRAPARPDQPRAAAPGQLAQAGTAGPDGVRRFLEALGFAGDAQGLSRDLAPGAP